MCTCSKIFFFKACIKLDDVSTFLIPRFIFDLTFGPKKEKLFCLVFIFHRGMSNAICVLVLYLCYILNISWPNPSTIPFQYLKIVFVIPHSTLLLPRSQFVFLKCERSTWDLGCKVRQNRAFSSLIFNFFYKRGNNEEDP